MPNQRKKGKLKATFWITERQRDLLRKVADDAELNMTDMFKEMLQTYADAKGIKLPASTVEREIKRRKESSKK